MVNERLPDPSDPEAVGRAEFSTQRRGFDQLQVRSYLKVVARELQRLKDRELELTREVDGLRRRLEDAEKTASDLDDATLTARLGEETARVLEAARTAAAEKVQRAEESAAETLARAKAEAEAIVGGAQAAFDAELEKARQKGRELVAEARLIRERTLDDLAHRRRSIRTQVEQLRSGRDRLLASHTTIRKLLDEIEQELEREMPEARVAAEFTGRRLQHEPPGSAGLIEIEIDEARRNGAPLATDEEIAARANSELPEWTEQSEDADQSDTPTGEDTAREVTDEPTDEIPVLDHFGAGDDLERPAIVLADVGHRKRDHRDLPREPVPVIEAPDDVEAVRVVGTDSGSPKEPTPEPFSVAPATSAVRPATENVEEDVAEPAAAESAEPAPEPFSVAAATSEVRPATENVEGDEAEPAAAEAEPEVAEPEVAEPVIAEPEPEPVLEVEPVVATAEGDADPAVAASGSGSGVDDLFARIRESRAENVARARQVLDQPLESSAVAVATRTDTATDSEPEADADEAAAAAAPAADVHPDAQRLAARDAAVADIESMVVRKIKRLLADEQNEVQDLVRRQRGKVDDAEVLGERDHHVGRYVAAVGGELLAAVSAGSSFYEPHGHAGTPDMSALDERLAHELLDPLRQLLARAIDEARGDEDELLDRTRSAYREVKTQRVDIAARVVTLSAFSLGIVSAQPEGALLRWAVDPVSGCSPDCDDNALAGAVVAGEEFPTGAVYPPNHPGCRCLLVPADQ
jgi:cell division septum initiation protein DivIVA